MAVMQTNGIHINFEERGSGEPLVLVMGLGADNSKWEDHVQEYEKHFRCIMVDNRGAGGSDKPDGPYSTEMMARDVLGLMDALGIDSARVAGISMGSCIAQHMALIRPDAVESMVLISSWARSHDYLRSLLDSFRKVREVSEPGVFMELLQLWIFSPGYFNAHIGDIKQGQHDAQTDANPMPQHAFSAQCDACITHNTIGRLNTINIPTLITVGEDDLFTPLELSHEIHDQIPGSELITFPGCAHVHHWEDLERFNAVTSEYLQSH